MKSLSNSFLFDFTTIVLGHGNHAPVSFSAIARSELIAAFAGLTRIRIKVSVAIHKVRLRVGRSLSVRLIGVRYRPLRRAKGDGLQRT
jgi:hypothetical protein